MRRLTRRNLVLAAIAAPMVARAQGNAAAWPSGNVRIVVPYIPGHPVLITGERDGGGGITVAVELSTGPLPLPPLAVGQTVALPIL